MKDDQKRGGGSRPEPERGQDIFLLPAAEVVLDRLADALFALDEILGMLQRAQDRRLDWLEPHIEKTYDEVNDLMKRLSN